MKTMLAIFLTMLCWGTYGPILHQGQESMIGHTRLLPFICVGLAYFVIAVIVPLIVLFVRGEQGSWTSTGTIWSLAAGAAGAIGALGIILALDKSGGNTFFVMPLVFGGAPVVNAFFTIYMSKSFKQVGPIFIAGLIMVALGAFTTVVGRQGLGIGNVEIKDIFPVLIWIGVVALSWGVYGPVLHKGQMKMSGSRLRPLICVGLSYFAIAVIVPFALVNNLEPNAEWTFKGTIWSLGAGSAGAIGALGIIMAFNFGGKPIYVMPLVFGGAPVVNTFVSILKAGQTPTNPFFYAGLILTAAGAVMVLVFAPKGGHAAPATPKEKATPAAT